MIKNLGRLISYGERTTRSYNFPNHIVYQIWTNTGSLEVVFDKKLDTIISSKESLRLDHKDLNGCLESLQESRSPSALPPRN